MNCKPNQLATVVRQSRSVQCVASLIGAIVNVEGPTLPRDGLDEAMEYTDGPLVQLDRTLHCPYCKWPFRALPARCLQPFDPNSKPSVVDELADMARDAGIPVVPLSKAKA